MSASPQGAKPSKSAPIQEGTGPSTLNAAASPPSTLVPPASAALAPARVGALPQQFGRYRIEKTLGRGGMGAVYLAHDEQLERQVALKVPHFAAADGWEVHQRFQREARAAATIEHPNICPIYDVGAIDGIPYVTMAYIDGRPLSDLVKIDKHLPKRPVAAVVRKLALAMHAAHGKGVVHRDLKPSNVMINKRNEPVIMDFGLARREDKDTRLTASGAILGTPAYMTPEQARGEESGALGDVYSLGVILYELLAGRLPFQGGTHAVLSQILTEEPAPPSQWNAEVDPALTAICLKAMAKKPLDRYQSMNELGAALADYLKGGSRPAGRRSEGQLPSTAAAGAAATTGNSGPPSAAPAGGEGLATQLLARLAERLESPPAPPPAPPEKARWGQWVLTIAGALLLVALTVGTAAVMNQRPQQVNLNATVEVAVQTIVPESLEPTVVLLVLDGRNVTREELAQPISMTPGGHELQIVRRDGTRLSRKFTVSQSSSVELEGLNETPQQSSPAAPTDQFPALAWDTKHIEQFFTVKERSYDPAEQRVSWILVSKQGINSPSIVAKFYDRQDIQIRDSTLEMTPRRVERSGVPVRAVLLLPPPGPGGSTSPVATAVRVVLEMSNPPRSQVIASTERVDPVAFIERVTWETSAFNHHFTVASRSYDPLARELTWRLKAKGKTKFAFSAPYVARFYDRNDDEGAKIDERGIHLTPINADAAGDNVLAELSLPSSRSTGPKDVLTRTKRVVIVDTTIE